MVLGQMSIVFVVFLLYLLGQWTRSSPTGICTMKLRQVTNNGEKTGPSGLHVEMFPIPENFASNSQPRYGRPSSN